MRSSYFFLHFMLILLLIPSKITAQAGGAPAVPPDTLYANAHKNVALFFPSPIRQGIAGADHFVFTYNREKPQYFGLLQAQPGPESNLLVISADGSVFSYIYNTPQKLDQRLSL